MKHALYSAAFALIALSLPASADPGDSTRSLTMAPVSKQAAPPAGAHAGRKFTLTRMKSGSFASDMLSHPIVLLVSAESTMQGGKQVITVSASSHLDGPDGPLEPVKKIGFRVTQPMVSQSKPNDKPVAEVKSSLSVPAAGGKYKTVVVEAFMSDDKFADTKATVTVPGDQ